MSALCQPTLLRLCQNLPSTAAYRGHITNCDDANFLLHQGMADECRKTLHLASRIASEGVSGLSLD
jgi:hypothetical protein